MKTFDQIREGVEEARAPRMKYALIGAKDMKIYSTGSDERDLKLDRRSLEKRFNQPLKIARLKTAQAIGDKVDKSQIKEAKRTVTIDKPDRLTSLRVSKDKPPFDNAKPVNKDPKDKFGNPIKNRARYLARKAARNEDSDAVKAFLAKGGKIKKLPPAKAQGYHGKDDPGKGMHGMMDKPDTKQMGTRKKVKSMEGNASKKEGYKSYAQQKAVWASRADAKKGKK